MRCLEARRQFKQALAPSQPWQTAHSLSPLSSSRSFTHQHSQTYTCVHTQFSHACWHTELQQKKKKKEMGNNQRAQLWQQLAEKSQMCRCIYKCNSSFTTAVELRSSNGHKTKSKISTLKVLCFFSPTLADWPPQMLNPKLTPRWRDLTWWKRWNQARVCLTAVNFWLWLTVDTLDTCVPYFIFSHLPLDYREEFIHSFFILQFQFLLDCQSCCLAVCCLCYVYFHLIKATIYYIWHIYEIPTDQRHVWIWFMLHTQTA